MRRAEAAGVHVLMLTLDVPVRTIRAREVKVGLGGGGVFKPDWRMVAGMAKCPGWARRDAAERPCRASPTSSPMPGPNAGLNDTIRFARKEMGGAFSWDEVRAIARGGKGRWWSRASCIRRTPRGRCRSAPMAFWCRTTAAARSRRCRRRSIACRRSQGRRQPRHRAVRFRRAQRHRRCTRARARCACGAGRQGVSVGPRRLGRRRTGPCDRSA